MDGGDMLLKDYRFSSARNSERVLFKKSDKPFSTFALVNLLLGQILGSNPLVAERFYNVGFINIVFSIGLAWILSQVSFNILIRTWRYDSETSYAESLKDALGPKTVTLTRIMMILSLSNNLLYNTRDIYAFWELIAIHIFPLDSIFHNKRLITYVFLLAFSIPTLFMREFSSYKYIAYFSNIMFVGVAIVCLVYMIESVKVRGFNPYGTTLLYSTDFLGSVNCFSNYVLQFYVHPIMCNVAKKCNETTQGGIIKVTVWANFCSFVVNLSVAYMCWFSLFGSSNGGLSLTKFPSSPLTAIGGFCGLLHILNTISMTIYLIAIDFTKLFISNKCSEFSLVPAGLCVAFFTLGLNFTLTFILDMFAMLCQLCFMIVGLFWPYFAYLKMFGLKSPFSIISIVMIILILMGGVIVMYSVFSRSTDR